MRKGECPSQHRGDSSSLSFFNAPSLLHGNWLVRQSAVWEYHRPLSIEQEHNALQKCLTALCGVALNAGYMLVGKGQS